MLENKKRLANNEEQKKHFKVVGERLKELRIKHGLSIKKLEALLEIPSGVVHNIEHGSGGTGVSLLTIINYWTQQGISYKWILDKDNQNSFMKEDTPFFMDIEKHVLVEAYEEVEEAVSKFKKKLNKF